MLRYAAVFFLIAVVGVLLALGGVIGKVLLTLLLGVGALVALAGLRRPFLE